LRQLIEHNYTHDEDQTNKKLLLGYLSKFTDDTPAPMEVSTDAASGEDSIKRTKQISPEVDSYISLLVIIYLIDKKHFDEVFYRLLHTS
jgi:hypothetical protein